MLILSLDTSGDICSLCLSDDARPRAVYHFRHERHLSERLPGIVEFVLRDGGCGGANGLREIEAFAVGLGPGSFTGVRVGVTMAKVWAHTLGRPLVGISSLDALAAEASALAPPGAGIAAVAPTRREEVVAAYYHGGNEGVVPVLAPAVTAHRDVAQTAAEALSLATGARLYIVGENAAQVAGAAQSGVAEIGLPIIARPVSVSAASVAALAAARLTRGEQDDAFALVPLYVTPSPVG